LKCPLPLRPSLPLVLLKHFARLLPSTFICDEVVFRGLLDSYVAPLSGSRSQAWISAIFISVLWAFWHTWHAWVLWDFALTFALGIPLSFCWRKSGTLLLPGTAHALIDTFRDTVLYGY
jgi:membrane protease YdiL (CAAX protease family)